jgi:hypothetical protein
MRSIPLLPLALALAAALPGAGGCAADDTQQVTAGDTTKAGDGKYDSSVEAVIVDFEFDGEVFSTSSFGASQQIQDQMMFTMGHLNGDRSVARLDRLVLSDVVTTPGAGGFTTTYRAKVPVAWGRKDAVPTSYTLTLPRSVAFDAQSAFFDKYRDRCSDDPSHAEEGNFWYYYRPHDPGCSIDAADVVELDATVTLSPIMTTGKYPEYHKVWEDGALNVVAVFGKNEDGATDDFDAGIAAFNSFVRGLKSDFAGFQMTTVPAVVPSNPGVALPDVTVDAILPDGRRVHVTALLVDQIRTAPPSFDARYAAVTPDADLVAYNGHSGLGANIRALSNKGEWAAGQYTIAFVNGCDTYAYVDSALAMARAALNPGDPTGSQHLDIVTNAMPSFFHTNARNDLAIIRTLLDIETPITYEKMFASIDSAQVVVVSGEHDNVFVPGFDPGGGGGEGDWQGLSQSGTVDRDQETRFESPVLAAGSYRFAITGTGDADLYVRVGQAPTEAVFDCRPFLNGSAESCQVDLNSDAPIHVMVRGWATSSSFQLVGAKQ